MNYMPAELIVSLNELIQGLAQDPEYYPTAASEIYDYFVDCLQQLDNMSAPLRICTGQTTCANSGDDYCPDLWTYQSLIWRCPADWQ